MSGSAEPPFTQARLAADLRALGVAPGDVVMVHAGLRSVGPVAGGVNAVVGAFLDAVGPPGRSSRMPTGRPAWTTGTIRASRDAIPVFDKRTARAARDHGIFAETLRTWPGTVRSDHPDAGIVALGARAEELCADHRCSTATAKARRLQSSSRCRRRS